MNLDAQSRIQAGGNRLGCSRLRPAGYDETSCALVRWRAGDADGSALMLATPPPIRVLALPVDCLTRDTRVPAFVETPASDKEVFHSSAVDGAGGVQAVGVPPRSLDVLPLAAF